MTSKIRFEKMTGCISCVPAASEILANPYKTLTSNDNTALFCLRLLVMFWVVFSFEDNTTAPITVRMAPRNTLIGIITVRIMGSTIAVMSGPSDVSGPTIDNSPVSNATMSAMIAIAFAMLETVSHSKPVWVNAIVFVA